MKKGKSRRYREARALKQADNLESIETLLGAEDVGEPRTDEICIECRRAPHADWCMAETP